MLSFLAAFWMVENFIVAGGFLQVLFILIIHLRIMCIFVQDLRWLSFHRPSNMVRKI